MSHVNDSKGREASGEAVLRKAGLRVTPQRLAIVGLLLGSKAHPSPEMVYRELKPAYPGLSLNTVYQTLHSLEEAGVLRRVGMEENVYRYDANVLPHPHLVCRSCGRVDDTDGNLEPVLKELMARAPQATGWDIRAMDCTFYGICPECRRREAASHESVKTSREE